MFSLFKKGSPAFFGIDKINQRSVVFRCLAHAKFGFDLGLIETKNRG